MPPPAQPPLSEATEEPSRAPRRLSLGAKMEGLFGGLFGAFAGAVIGLYAAFLGLRAIALTGPPGQGGLAAILLSPIYAGLGILKGSLLGAAACALVGAAIGSLAKIYEGSPGPLGEPQAWIAARVVIAAALVVVGFTAVNSDPMALLELFK